MENDKTQGTPGAEDTGAAIVKENEHQTPPVGSEPTPKDNEVPVNKTGGEGNDDDPSARLEALQAEKELLEKRYKDAERKITELGQDRSETRRNFENLSSAIVDLRQQLKTVTKKPLPSTEEFIKAINTKGVEPIMDLINDVVSEKTSQFESASSEKDEAYMKMELEFEKMKMESDTTNYPGFKELWPEIQKLAADEAAPVNYSAGVKPALHALYKLVKSDHSGDAIKAAEAEAAKRKEEQLAREANAGTAGGGKKGSGAGMTDAEMRKMDTAKLRELVASVHGVADRD